jgi:hypothetical protein
MESFSGISIHLYNFPFNSSAHIIKLTQMIQLLSLPFTLGSQYICYGEKNERKNVEGEGVLIWIVEYWSNIVM